MNSIFQQKEFPTMRPAPIYLRLGEHSWRLRPLTLAQIQDVESILADVASTGARQARDILAVALRRDNTAAADEIDKGDVETTIGELGEAMRQILRLGGFLSNDHSEKPPGEGEAGAPPASQSPSTGAGSTRGS